MLFNKLSAEVSFKMKPIMLVCTLQIHQTEGLYIQGFTNFTAAYFVTKCHHTELFAKILSLPLVLDIALFESLHKTHSHR